MAGEQQRIFPVLLSGGAGSRLWPLSRANAPKQLVRLIGERTLLQQTALRALDSDLFETLTVIGAENHRFLVAEQLRQIGVTDATIVLEPVSRNTAAAAAVAALLVSRASPDGLILLMPADHVIDDVEAFCKSVREASASARCGHLTLFGIKPDDAATGYGYIRVGPPLDSAGAARRVAAFVEKPDRETAEAYIATGDYLWNSGIFLLPVQQLLAEFRAHEPDLLEGASEALEKATSDADFLRLEREALARCPAASLDYAIMERTDKAAVVAAGFGWTDVGCWSSLWSLAERDEAETAAIGDVLTWATRASYVRSEGPLVATLGIEGLIVVATKDAVLVAGKDYDQDIREIVACVRAKYPSAE